MLPYYDPIWITGDRDDPDAVLNGYGAQWHIDRATLELTHSDELDGEDGTLTIGEADHTYDDFSVVLWRSRRCRGSISKAPLAWHADRQAARST